MTVSDTIRNQLLVEAQHRCTICYEKCFQVHHIVAQSEGGTDDPENLIVLCPNCHLHRYHRDKEFTPTQLRLYKQKLKEKNEIERRVLQNLEDIQKALSVIPIEDSERALRAVINEAARLVSPDESPDVFKGVQDISKWLAERELIRGGARKAIEVEWDVQIQREKEKCKTPKIIRIDEDGWKKVDDFPEAYQLVFVLDSVPSREWTTIFDEFHQHSLYFMKRDTYITGNRIVMIVASQDNIQGHADYAKSLIAETNEFIKKTAFPRIKAHLENEKNKALKEFDTIQSLKGKMNEINL